MKNYNNLCWVMITFILVALMSHPVAAQEEDNSGTNPVNFTFDFSTWVELQSWDGENSYTKTGFAYSVPLSPALSVRYRAYKVDLSLGNGATASTTTGLGDMDARVLWIPKLSQKGALALGLEATFNTASQPILGGGKTTLGPQAFLVIFNPFGIKGSLLAPAYQYIFDVGGDSDRSDVSRSGIDLFFVWLAPAKNRWLAFNATELIDHENDVDYGTIKVNYGQLMVGPISSFIKPGVAIGSDRPYEWNVELGFKFVWK